MDLAQNKLQNWKEVFTILAHMPRVEFVNLSLNPLLGPVEPPLGCDMTNLRNLVLNNTRLDWDSVEKLIKRLPSLEELHLSLNEYRNVLIDTVDDDVFSEENSNVPTSNEEVENEKQSEVCSSCGSKTNKTTESEENEKSDNKGE